MSLEVSDSSDVETVLKIVNSAKSSTRLKCKLLDRLISSFENRRPSSPTRNSTPLRRRMTSNSPCQNKSPKRSYVRVEASDSSPPRFKQVHGIGSPSSPLRQKRPLLRSHNVLHELDTFGGSDAIMVLLSRVVGNLDEVTVQNKVLLLLLCCLKTAPQEKEYFALTNGYEKLGFLFQREKFTFDTDTAEMLVSFTFSSDQKLILDENLLGILVDWHTFARSPANCWSIVINALRSSLDSEFRTYNLGILEKQNAIRALTFCPLERAMENLVALPPVILPHYISFLRSVIISDFVPQVEIILGFMIRARQIRLDQNELCCSHEPSDKQLRCWWMTRLSKIEPAQSTVSDSPSELMLIVIELIKLLIALLPAELSKSGPKAKHWNSLWKYFQSCADQDESVRCWMLKLLEIWVQITKQLSHVQLLTAERLLMQAAPSFLPSQDLIERALDHIVDANGRHSQSERNLEKQATTVLLALLPNLVVSPPVLHCVLYNFAEKCEYTPEFAECFVECRGVEGLLRLAEFCLLQLPTVNRSTVTLIFEDLEFILIVMAMPFILCGSYDRINNSIFKPIRVMTVNLEKRFGEASKETSLSANLELNLIKSLLVSFSFLVSLPQSEAGKKLSGNDDLYTKHIAKQSADAMKSRGEEDRLHDYYGAIGPISFSAHYSVSRQKSINQLLRNINCQMPCSVVTGMTSWFKSWKSLPPAARLSQADVTSMCDSLSQTAIEVVLSFDMQKYEKIHDHILKIVDLLLKHFVFVGAPRSTWDIAVQACNSSVINQISRILFHVLMADIWPTAIAMLNLFSVHDNRMNGELSQLLAISSPHGPNICLVVWPFVTRRLSDIATVAQHIDDAILFASELSKAAPISLPASVDTSILQPLSTSYFASYREQFCEKNESLTNDRPTCKFSAPAYSNWSLFDNPNRKNQKAASVECYLMDMAEKHRKQSLLAAEAWRNLTEQFSNDSSCFHDPQSFPGSWQLDEMRGPHGELNRLRRCFLKGDLSPNLVLSNYRFVIEISPDNSPSGYLFTTEYSDPINSSVRLYCCRFVSVAREASGQLYINDEVVSFNGHVICRDYDGKILPESNLNPQVKISVATANIKQAQCLDFKLRPVGLELVIAGSPSLLFVFAYEKDRDKIYHYLSTSDSLNCNISLDCKKASQLANQWTEHQLTNFDYLSLLNVIAGRSYNDLMQYPIFPFVLSNYTGEAIDLADSNNYRDLSAPLAIQHDRQSAVRRYQERFEFFDSQSKGCHFQSYYSTFASVVHALVRLPPFTVKMAKLQGTAIRGDSFDAPGRTFRSFANLYKVALCLNQSASGDPREALPQFYTTPEIFTNDQGFDFGSITKNNEKIAVNDVELPPWCNGDARLFVLIMRQALESPLVTGSLHHWIDLMFGFKLKGSAAKRAINVFRQSYNREELKADPELVDAMTEHLGQVPLPVFTHAHPAADVRQTTSSRQLHGYIDSTLPFVRGLSWGEFVGSPVMPEPTANTTFEVANSMSDYWHNSLSLLTEPIPPLRNSCVIRHTAACNDMGLNTVNCFGILQWLRNGELHLHRNGKDVYVINHPFSHLKITYAACALSINRLILGTSSGSIITCAISFSDENAVDFISKWTRLCAHRQAVSSISICEQFGIFLSVDADFNAVIWDLNRLCYIRMLSTPSREPKSPVSCLSTTSPTLGDVVIALNYGDHSKIQLFNVNGKCITEKTFQENITAMTYSNLPEGRNVNVLVTGFSSGTIQILSSWTLSKVRNLDFPNKLSRPTGFFPCHIRYSDDHKTLYAAFFQPETNYEISSCLISYRFSD